MSRAARRYALLPTERPNPATRDIDRLPPLEIVRAINREDARVAPAVAREAAKVAAAAEAIARSLAAGGKLLFVGAGTSGRLAVLEAAECPPTFGTPPSLVRAVMAGGKSAVFKAKEGAEDDARAGAAAVAHMKKGDVVAGIAASGVTPFVRGALAAASARGCVTVLISSGDARGARARFSIAPKVGPEVLAGSTRLKSASAAKLVLNQLTVTAMIRLGKVYDHWMVDLKLNSKKLRLRAARIVVTLGRVPPARAERLLRACGGSVKLAVAVARTGLSPELAKRALALAGGNLRAVLEENA